ncbi:MAG: GDP-mannose 4,6 dehydratase [Deltaproteobacteria bacterium]|nr:GDP-mannose 4,6 dehydratase [Deltaproteobacteria bacterium]
MGDLGRALITGASGFVGGVMGPALAEQGWEVVPTGRATGDVIALDVTDEAAVRDIMTETTPGVVVHLAGITYLPAVLEDPKWAFRVNVLGTRNVLDAALRVAPSAKVLVVSSCTVFGNPTPEDLPLREDAPLRSLHPYGVQKIGSEVIADDYRDQGLDVRVVRPFNHVGPGLHPRLSLAFFAGQIVAAERGERDPVLRVGNLDARRDFTDVRDVVRAYRLVLDLPATPPVLHVATGRSLRIGDVLDMMIARARVPLTVETDPGRLRSIDVPDLVGDATRLHELTGWSPRVPFDETLERILAHARGEDYGGRW